MNVHLSRIAGGIAGPAQGGVEPTAGSTFNQIPVPLFSPTVSASAPIASVAASATSMLARALTAVIATPIIHGPAIQPSAAPATTIDVIRPTSDGNRAAPDAIMLGKTGPNPKPIRNIASAARPLIVGATICITSASADSAHDIIVNIGIAMRCPIRPLNARPATSPSQ